MELTLRHTELAAMLYTFLLILLIIDSIILCVAILMQSGQGGGMAASFGGVSSSASSFLGTRQTGNLLTKASWWCGGIFLGLSFLLALASSRSRTPKSVLDQAFPNAPVTAPANTAPAGGANPTIPLSPAPTTTAPAPANGAQGSASKPAPATPAPTKKP